MGTIVRTSAHDAIAEAIYQQRSQSDNTDESVWPKDHHCGNSQNSTVSQAILSFLMIIAEIGEQQQQLLYRCSLRMQRSTPGGGQTEPGLENW